MSGGGISVSRVKRKRERSHRFSLTLLVKKLIVACFIAGVAVAVLFCYQVYQKYFPTIKEYYEYADKVVSNSSLSDFKSEQTSYVYDAKGAQLTKLSSGRDVNYVEWSRLPENLVDAVVAIEDKRYWEHHGVDWKSTAKAGLLYLKDSGDIKRGGSTITQQLARGIYLNYEQKLERKFKEIFIALELEQRYSKEQIFEYYINNINFANGYYGIGAAAKGYFNKSASELKLEEITFLVAIPNNPSYYDPVKYPKHTTYRRNLILKQMWQQGMISEKQYWKVSNSPIHFYKPPNKNYNYETSYAIECAVRALMRRSGFKFRYQFNSDKDYKKYCKRRLESYGEAKAELYTGGYRIYTSIEPKAQKALQKSIDKTLKGFKEKKHGVYKVQGAATVVDNETGLVVAMVGGRSQNFNGVLTLNRAYQSYRQPGSTFKPLAVYTPAFECGYRPESTVDDSPIEDGPKNSDGQYEGTVTLRHAVEKSKNVVAWRLFNSIGPQSGLRFVQSMQFSRIVPSDYYLSSALGGLTYGVSTVEMASGYATLANDGVFREPTCVKRITLASGENVITSKVSYRVYSEDASRMMTDVLQGVAKRGTAKGLSIGGMPIACKTGTTNNQTNGWFCGYTPYYSVACYVGCDQEERLDGLWGSTYPKEIWQRIQERLCKGKKIKAFKKVTVVKPKATAKPAESPTVVQWNHETSAPGVLATPTPVVEEQTSGDNPLGDDAEVTEAPVATEKPLVTKKPKVTKKPEPVVTKKPKPTITKEPEKPVEEPKEPEESEEPEEVSE